VQLRSTTAKRVLVTLTTVFLTTTATVGAARAGDTFLLVEDLPADATWVADGIVAGEPEIEEFCVGEVIQPEGTRHQPYHTDLDAFARQHVTTSTTEGAAARLQRRLNSAVRGCAEAYEEQHPGSTAIFKRYREREIADGVAVYGVFTEDDFGALSANLFAVGRDGTEVTVVRYGRIGRESVAPVRAFERTAKRAVELLVQ